MSNADLTKDLKAAMAGRRNFVMSVLGDKCHFVKLKKAAIVNDDKKEARAAKKSSKAFVGYCDGDGEEAVTFWFTGVDAVPVEDVKVRKFLAEEIGRKLSVTCKVVEGEGVVDGVVVGAVAGSGAPDDDPDDPDGRPGGDDTEAPDLKKQLATEWNLLAPLVAEIAKARPDKAAKLVEKVRALRGETDALRADTTAGAAAYGAMIQKVIAFRLALAKLAPARAEADKPADKAAAAEQRLATVVFEGDKGKMAVFAKQFGGADKLQAAIAKVKKAKQARYDASVAENDGDTSAAEANLKVTGRTIYMALEQAFVKARGAAVAAREKAVADGDGARKMQAAVDGLARCDGAGAKHKDVRAMAAEVAALKAEIAARGLAGTDPVAIEALALAPDREQGDEAFQRKQANMLTFREELLKDEPLVIMAAKVEALKPRMAALIKRLSGPKFVFYGESRDLLATLEQERARMAEDLAAKFKSGGEMQMSQQNMVASAGDLDAIAARFAATEGLTDENQAWSLVAAGLKGAQTHDLDRAKALEKLEDYNRRWGTKYDEADLDRILSHMVSGALGTNYTFARKPGANIDTDEAASNGVPLTDRLIADPKFRNLWEIGASQASTDTARRGGVEEQMGYASPLNRTAGAEQTVGQAAVSGSGFDPAKEDRGVMPKYAGAMGDFRADHGGAPRYGASFVVWKPEAVAARTTFVAGDSWSGTDQGAGSFSGAGHPEAIFVSADEGIVRALAAEATGKDQDFLAKGAEGVAGSDAYIEAQIHGDLGWEHVAEVVVGKDDGDDTADTFRAFGRDNGYDFAVRQK